MSDEIKKVSIIVSRGSLDGVYPGLIMANGARMEGIEANLFFTFFGLETIIKKKMDKIKVATVGNPGMHMPSILGIIPGFSAFATSMMKKEMDKIDIPPVSEFVEMIYSLDDYPLLDEDLYYEKENELLTEYWTEEINSVLSELEFQEIIEDAELIKATRAGTLSVIPDEFWNCAIIETGAIPYADFDFKGYLVTQLKSISHG